MSKRFPDYQPSTALRQAIEALNAAKARQAVGPGQSAAQTRPKKRRNGGTAGEAGDHSGQSTGGTPGASLPTPGRKGASAGIAGGLRDTDDPGTGSGTGALTSGRNDGPEEP